ncbi:Vacuolar protein sorting-associated protein 2 homolog 3 [Zea mays]|uniref:Vacuolar protein sorting-associated protein 2 homolog 3 n=1 Tax=Zea mays TaxID=4577 RepID=A0A1D6KTI4_MAIZE|nr:Vacuolar protein sorting-associated protein 2 homolog 3 [Zea mays]
MNPFAKKPTPREVMRSSKRDLTNATRGIERDIASLQQEEKKLVAEIKRTAKTGNEVLLLYYIQFQAATKILARQLIRLRQQISNLQGSRAQIRGIATHTQAMHANTSVATGLQSASKAMGALNKQMEPTKQMKIMQEFQKQSAQMDMTNEMMSDSIDDVLDDDQAEEETEELANQVLDEIGVDIASQLSSAPKGKIAGKKVQVDGRFTEITKIVLRLYPLYLGVFNIRSWRN